MTYRCALITGATSGIGEAFARALPESATLLLTGRDRARLAQLAASLERADRPVHSLAADLATPEGRRAVIDFAADREIDLLINNAGIGHLGPVADSPPGREMEMTQVNVAAPVEITRALLPGMVHHAASGHRCGLIFVASVAAFMPIPLFATYAASKAFLLHYAEALAEELSVAPVDVLALDEALEKLARDHPRKADLVKLRFFAGLTNDEAAEALGVSPSTVDNDWAYARSWLRVELGGRGGRHTGP